MRFVHISFKFNFSNFLKLWALWALYIFRSTHVFISGQCKSESKITSELFNGSLCKEDAEFKDMVEKWAESTHKLELQMNELVGVTK